MGGFSYGGRFSLHTLWVDSIMGAGFLCILVGGLNYGSWFSLHTLWGRFSLHTLWVDSIMGGGET